MNKEPTEQQAPAENGATLSAATLLEIIKTIGKDVEACAATAREAVSLSVLPECHYESTLQLYMEILGVSGKISFMLSEMSPEVESLLATEAMAARDRTRATSH